MTRMYENEMHSHSCARDVYVTYGGSCLYDTHGRVCVCDVILCVCDVIYRDLRAYDIQ